MQDYAQRLQLKKCTFVHCTSYIVHRTSYIVHRTSYIVHRTSYIVIRAYEDQILHS